VDPLQTPSGSHVEFDAMCAEVDEFEPLPTVSARPHERESQDEEETPLDGQILVGLVSPV
jgi:hypothetical protein